MAFCSLNAHMQGKLHIQRPPGNIQLMSSVIAGFGCSVIPAIPVPVIVPRLRGILPSRGRSLKEVPVKSGGYRGFLPDWHFTATTGIKSYSFVGSADYTIMYFLYYLNRVAARPLLVSHLHYPIVLLHRLYQQFILIHIMTAGFLYIDMFTALHGHYGTWCMPVVGRSIEDSVNFGIVNDPPYINLS